MVSTLNELAILLLIASVGGIWFAVMSYLKPGSSHKKATRIWLVAAILAFVALLIPWSLGSFNRTSDDYPQQYGDRPY